MPRKYTPKTEFKPPDPSLPLEALKLVKILKKSKNAAALKLGIPPSNVQRLCNKFDKWIEEGDKITENKLMEFMNSTKINRGKSTVSLNFFVIFVAIVFYSFCFLF